MFRPGWKKPNLFFYWPKPDPSSGPKNPNPSPPDVWPHSPRASPWAVTNTDIYPLFHREECTEFN